MCHIGDMIIPVNHLAVEQKGTYYRLVSRKKCKYSATVRSISQGKVR